MSESKLVYIASPYAGDVEANVEFAKKACRHCIDQGHTPLAVHLLYPQILDDSDPAQRQAGLKLGHSVLAACDELWIYGDRISPGMGAEIAEAGKMGKPIRQVSVQQMFSPPAEQFGIWAETTPGTRLSGQSGFLCRDNRLMTFDRRENAEFRMDEIRKMCLNATPAATYRVENCNLGNLPQTVFRTIDYEAIRTLDAVPGFEPENFEVRKQDYGNTGGGCMVATTEVYLPELDRTLWVNTNDEGISITAVDYVWQEDTPEGFFHEYEDVLLFQHDYADGVPDAAQPWVPMCKAAIEYTIQQENNHYKRAMPVPVCWLPDSIRQATDPEYLQWAEEKGVEVDVMNGQVEFHEDYTPAAQTAAQGGMELQ